MNGHHRLHPAWRPGGHTHTHTRTHTHTHTRTFLDFREAAFVPKTQNWDPATKPPSPPNQPSQGSEPLRDSPRAVLERSPIFSRVPSAGELGPPPPAPASLNTQTWTRMHARVHTLKTVIITIIVIFISSHLRSAHHVPSAQRAFQVHLSPTLPAPLFLSLSHSHTHTPTRARTRGSGTHTPRRPRG